MKILSFDVGIKNLAYIIIEFETNNENILEYKILDWDIIDLSKIFLEKNVYCSVTKHGNVCKNIALNYVKLEKIKLGFCKNKVCQSVLNSTYKKKNIKKYKKITTKDISLFELGTELVKKLKLKENLLNVDIIVIENQPVLKNPTMKSIQMILYSFFLINNNNNCFKIVLFNALKKLDIYDGPDLDTNYDKKNYNHRKKLSIEYTKYFLDKNKEIDRLEFFNKNSKKDDLADCYLQCLTYYNKNKSKLNA